MALLELVYGELHRIAEARRTMGDMAIVYERPLRDVMRGLIAAALVVAGCGSKRDAPPESEPPAAPPSRVAPPVTPPPIDASDASAPLPPAPPPSAPPLDRAELACRTDADCPSLACGPCRRGDVVTTSHVARGCVVNPCPDARATCRNGTCVVGASRPRRAPGALSLHPDRDAVRASMDGRNGPPTIPAFGKTFPAASYCVEDALLNSDHIEVYRVADRDDVMVIYCPPTLDDEQSSVAVFIRGESPVRLLVTPERGSCCLSDDQLHRVVARLLR